MTEESKPTPQSWYDENRQLFNAETTITEPKIIKCPHDGYLVRIKETNEVQCKQCMAGWLNLPLNIKDGKIIV